jgi:hypothetical protein
MMLSFLLLVGAIYYHDFMSVFPRHGVVNYDLDFIHALPKKCNYILLFEPFRNPVLMLDDDGEEIVTYLAAYRKVDNEPFMTLEEFSALPGLKNIVGQYGLYRRVVRRAFSSCMIYKTCILQFHNLIATLFSLCVI